LQVSNNSHRLSQAALFTLPADIITAFLRQTELWELATEHWLAISCASQVAVVQVSTFQAAVVQAAWFIQQLNHFRQILTA
jgi:hypothetical protein